MILCQRLAALSDKVEEVDRDERSGRIRGGVRKIKQGEGKKNKNTTTVYPVCSFTVVVIDFDTEPAGQSERRGSQLSRYLRSADGLNPWHLHRLTSDH